MPPVLHQKNSRLATTLRLLLPGLLGLILGASPGPGAANQSLAVAGTPPQEKLQAKRGPGWRPSSPRCPLPPASAFFLQANLRKYLETWPDPGSTSVEDWPEYAPEEGEGVN
jgi:hypothetical protein